MGRGSWTAADWTRYASSTIKGKDTRSIYRARSIAPEYDPKNITFRESRDSIDHPNSTPIIIGLDVTGSMSNILQVVAEKLGGMVQEILNRKPVSDPQIMFNAIGDSTCDTAPLQATQFESDIRIAKQLTDLWFERGGGGNHFESYPLTWYFAANHTKTDANEKHGRKGFIFTMGDDCFPTKLTARELREVFGDTVPEDISVQEVLAQANRSYEIFHLMLQEGGSAGIIQPDKWHDLMGERAINVLDYTKIPEIIVSILEVMGDKSMEEVIGSWDGTTGLIVKEAIKGLSKNQNKGNLVEF